MSIMLRLEAMLARGIPFHIISFSQPLSMAEQSPWICLRKHDTLVAMQLVSFQKTWIACAQKVTDLRLAK